ncbi:hypothetical protein OPT61_g4880 [Boeremia exigua]|uniref:Uncharacterized protein n=1 Tax=Boeremia exigua TaxID=749465 RepID=A0ACC2ICM2_9PLEO|nr:hypothetical protein OPT61_g4880 [Boeremia exigua]
MAPTPPLLEAAVSPIERLPPELLDRIFLHVVNDITLLNTETLDRDIIDRLRTALKTGISTTVQALRFRLACRRFCYASWRAFGKVVSMTMFDIRSKESMRNFQAIAEQPALAPWVKAINFTCITASVQWPQIEVPNPEFKMELYKVQQEEESWFPEGFSTFDFSSPVDDDDKVIGALTHILARSLQQLPNVQEVTYFWDGVLLPQRLAKVLEAIPNSCGSNPERNLSAGYEADAPYLGLNIFIRALLDAGTKPHVLDLALQLGDSHAFFINLTSDDLGEVFQRVELLTLRDRYYPFEESIHKNDTESRVCLTKHLFPALRSLTVDYNGWELEPAISFPPKDNLPELSDITICNGDAMIPYFGPFLEHYGRHIQNFCIVNSEMDDPEAMLHVTWGMSLEVLRVYEEPNAFWERRIETVCRGERSTEDFTDRLAAVARKVVLEPPKFKEYMDVVYGPS